MSEGSAGKLGLCRGLCGLRTVFQHDLFLVRRNQMFVDARSRRRLRVRERERLVALGDVTVKDGASEEMCWHQRSYASSVNWNGL